MDKISILKASELFSKSRRTIQRYISNGKLSYTEQLDGTRLLDIPELEANFGILSPPVISQLSPNDHPNLELIKNNALLEMLIDISRQQLAATKENTLALRNKNSEVEDTNIRTFDKPTMMKAEPITSNYIDNMPTMGNKH